MKAIAEAIRVSSSITSVDVGFNQIGKEQALNLIKKMANVIGVELRAMLVLGDNGTESWAHPSIDCWGPVVNLNRDPSVC